MTATALVRTVLLFIATALAEIAGCYLPYLWLRKGSSALVLIPAAMSLGAFSWLLTLHPTAAARTYAAYGGVYVVTSIVWLRVVEHTKLSPADLVGAGFSLFGMAIVVIGNGAHS